MPTKTRAAGALLAFILLAGPSLLAAEEPSRTELVIGTFCTVRIVDGPRGKDAERALDASFAKLHEIEDTLSANKDGTDVDRVNRAAGGAPVRVSDMTYYVLGKALEYARLTNGAFDPTVGPLVKLWGIGTPQARLPSRQEIDAARRLIDWRKVAVDPAARTVRLAAPGMRIDLGAIAKGYAADEVGAILKAAKTKAAIVDLGGNVYALGEKRDRSPWRIGVQVPLPENEAPRGSYLGVVEGKDFTVVTSGVYERFFEKDGTRYHHILDTGTGYPVKNGLVSVTIITTKSIDADGLSTSLFALGRERGMALAATLPGVQVVMVDDADRVYLSPGAAKIFKLTSADYSLAD